MPSAVWLAEGSLGWLALTDGEQLFRNIIAPQVGVAEVAEADLGGCVAGLAHQFGEAGARTRGGRVASPARSEWPE